MGGRRLRAALALTLLALGAAAGGVVAATDPSDEEALSPARRAADRGVERRVDDLLRRMTLQEKLQQIALLPDFKATDDEIRKGLGSILSVTDPAQIRRMQTIAVNESRLKIPLLFAFDTIHGFRTVFPIPLGTGASFDPQMAADDAKYGARESTAVGHQADLRADDRRLARAALGADLRGGRRGPVPERGDGRRAGEGHAGRRLQRA